MRSINLQLEESLLRKIENMATELQLTPEQAIHKALKDFFYLERVTEVRERLSKKSRTGDLENEDQIFDQIS